MVTTPAAWLRLVGGLALIFALFQWSATMLQSDRGQAGLQGTVKLVILEDSGATFPIWWMLASAIVPQLVFLIPRPGRIAPAAHKLPNASESGVP